MKAASALCQEPVSPASWLLSRRLAAAAATKAASAAAASSAGRGGSGQCAAAECGIWTLLGEETGGVEAGQAWELLARWGLVGSSGPGAAEDKAWLLLRRAYAGQVWQREREGTNLRRSVFFGGRPR